MQVNGYSIAPDAILTGADLRHADLTGADLRHADLTGAALTDAILTGADLRRADLRRAVLTGADMRRADLRHADLTDAILTGADLRHAALTGAVLTDAALTGAVLTDAALTGADLRHADLTGAVLTGAVLTGADLTSAKIPPLAAAQTSICPDGILTVYKKCREGIVTLQIPANAARSNATGRKCRAEYADVLETPNHEPAHSQHDSSFQYVEGKTVRPAEWCADRWQECAGGIHFFLTRIEAENYS